MRKEVEVLVLEDNLRDEALIEEQLRQLGPVIHTYRVETAGQLLRELNEHPPDLAILDHGRPALTAFEALSLVKERQPNVPCITIVPNGFVENGDPKGLATMVITKDRLSGLGPVVRHVLSRSGNHEIAQPKMGSEEQLRLFIEAAHDYAIYMLDSQGHVASWNSGAQRLAGYEAEEVLGRHFSTLFAPDEVAIERAQHDLEEARATGSSESEGWTVRKDGTRFWSRSSLTAVRDEDGKLVGFLRIAHDITQEREAQVELQKLNRQLAKRVRERTAELETLNKELEAFTYSVAHDLKAPLRHITAFADQLQGHAGSKLEAEDRDYLQVISRSARTLSEMVAALLNLSRLGRKPLEKVPADLTRLVRRVIDELRHDVGHREVAWQIDTLPQVDADPTLMRQVFLNLLGNALKYSRDRAVARIHIGYKATETEHVIFVRDNGVGFEMELVGKLFGVFQRLHRGEDFDGTGVGLAVVRRIVQKHGGHTWAEGEPDKGATFYFSLPK